MERRKFERVPLREPVVVEIDAVESLLGHAADLSIGGMFVEGMTAPFGTRVVIHMRFNGPDWTVALPAVVRWTRGHGIGVRFDALGARETFAITEAMARARPSGTRVSAMPTQDAERSGRRVPR